jgi:hypothetical protein
MTVRSRSLISALLMLTLCASASACVNGTGTGFGAACRISHPRLSALGATENTCGHAFNTRVAQCPLRGLLQFQFLTLSAFQIAVPIDVIAETVTVPSDSTAKLTSVGSPETDRGPPRSR